MDEKHGFSDESILALYSLWSEEFYAASFMHPDEHTVRQFREWLVRTDHAAQEDYEHEMLRLFHSLETTESAVSDRDPVQ